MAVFTWIPSKGLNISEEPKLLESGFGDRYVQSIPDGINNCPKVWSLTFKMRKPDEAADIRAFLKDHGGYLAFDWTDPDGDTLRYVCKKWPRAFDSGYLQTFSLVFEQRFGV